MENTVLDEAWAERTMAKMPDHVKEFSKSAVTQANRAARKIIREFEQHNLPVYRNGDVSEELLGASYDEARDRNIYQSDAYMEFWWDWRSYVENTVIGHFLVKARREAMAR